MASSTRAFFVDLDPLGTTAGVELDVLELDTGALRRSRPLTSSDRGARAIITGLSRAGRPGPSTSL
jgi:hypothetical protein